MSRRDTWERHDTASNHKLLQHLIANGARYTKSYPGKNAEVSKILQRFKETWARDMRDADRDQQKPADGGDAWWAQNMTDAEAEIVKQLGAPAA